MQRALAFLPMPSCQHSERWLITRIPPTMVSFCFICFSFYTQKKHAHLNKKNEKKSFSLSTLMPAASQVFKVSRVSLQDLMQGFFFLHLSLFFFHVVPCANTQQSCVYITKESIFHCVCLSEALRFYHENPMRSCLVSQKLHILVFSCFLISARRFFGVIAAYFFSPSALGVVFVCAWVNVPLSSPVLISNRAGLAQIPPTRIKWKMLNTLSLAKGITGSVPFDCTWLVLADRSHPLHSSRC